MTLQEHLIEYIVSKGLAVGYGDDCFSDIVPSEPDNLISFYEYEGDPLNPFAGFVNRSMQVIVRNVSPDVSRQVSWSIYKSFIADTENLLVKFTGSKEGQVYLRQTPFKLKEDENGRIYYCFNMGISTSVD